MKNKDLVWEPINLEDFLENGMCARIYVTSVLMIDCLDYHYLFGSSGGSIRNSSWFPVENRTVYCKRGADLGLKLIGEEAREKYEN